MYLNYSKAFIEYSNEEYNPNKKREILLVFRDMIVDMLNNNKLNPIVTELFIRGKKLNISLVFITQSLFCSTKKYYTKFYALFYYDNSKQARASTNCI